MTDGIGEKLGGSNSASNDAWSKISDVDFSGDNKNEESKPLVEQFRVNPADFPFFTEHQKERGPRWGDPEVHVGIDETLSRMVTRTADTIAVIDGSNKNSVGRADHVVYLDKSARPVSWLVNVFWDRFASKDDDGKPRKRPEHSYLAVDRRPWFLKSGVELDSQEYTESPDGSMHVATFEDFNTDMIPAEDLARIRALYLVDGVQDETIVDSSPLTEEQIEQIMSSPTILDGKDVLIIDEVSRSGSTVDIAKWLIETAIPETKRVRKYEFWPPGSQINPIDHNSKQMRSVPAWYDSDSTFGRGIGEIDVPFFERRYQKHPDSKTRAQMVGAIALGSFVDLNEELAHRSSRELAREIKEMRRQFDEGRILMQYPNEYPVSKFKEIMEARGVKFTRDVKDENSYVYICENIKKRPYKR